MNTKDLESVVKLEDLCGVWQSVDYSPTLLIYKDHSLYKVAILNISVSGQVVPEICPIEGDQSGFHAYTSLGKSKLTFDNKTGRLIFTPCGAYICHA